MDLISMGEKIELQYSKFSELKSGDIFGLVDMSGALEERLTFIGQKLVKEIEGSNTLCIWILPERLGDNNWIKPGELTCVTDISDVANVNQFDLYFNG